MPARLEAEVLQGLRDASRALGDGDAGEHQRQADVLGRAEAGTRWKLWNTKPMRALRTAACSSAESVVTSRPSSR